MTDELENLFDALSGNKRVEVDINDNKVELDLGLDDLSPILAMGEDEEPSDEDVQEIIEAFRNGLKRRYLPYYDKVRDQPFENLSEEQKQEMEDAREKIEAILRDNIPTFFRKVPESLGWVDEMDALDQDFRQSNSPQN